MAEVEAAAFAVCDCFLASDMLSPYCRVPILMSRMHGDSYLDTRFSSRMYSAKDKKEQARSVTKRRRTEQTNKQRQLMCVGTVIPYRKRGKKPFCMHSLTQFPTEGGKKDKRLVCTSSLFSRGIGNERVTKKKCFVVTQKDKVTRSLRSPNSGRAGHHNGVSIPQSIALSQWGISILKGQVDKGHHVQVMVLRSPAAETA